MNRKIILLMMSIVFIYSVNVGAQNLSFHFPHFANQKWSITIFHGERQDTISSGFLDASGNSTVTLPDSYKDYRGLINWLLKDGNGLSIIKEGDDQISVSCLQAQLSDKDITYTGTSGNIYLNERFEHLSEILKKIDAMTRAEQAYSSSDQNLSSLFNKELKKQEQAYNLLQKETGNNSSYAARFAEIVDVTRRLPPSLSGDMSKNDRLIIDFIVHRLDVPTLYTSMHWDGVLGQWLSWYAYNPANESQIIEDYQILHNRITDKEIQAVFEKSVNKLLKEMNRSDLALLTQQREAPALTQGKFSKKKTILVFYQTGCGNCTVQMKNLVDAYPDLVKKGYTVISIAADMDKATFEESAKDFPWKDKLCDYKGFDGQDFINYKVIGTPTFYQIDEKGIIRGIYAQIENMKLN